MNREPYALKGARTVRGGGSAYALPTPLATWAGSVYVSFVIDVYARYIVGWRASRTAHASFVLDALE